MPLITADRVRFTEWAKAPSMCMRWHLRGRKLATRNGAVGGQCLVRSGPSGADSGRGLGARIGS